MSELSDAIPNSEVDERFSWLWVAQTRLDIQERRGQITTLQESVENSFQDEQAAVTSAEKFTILAAACELTASNETVHQLGVLPASLAIAGLGVALVIKSGRRKKERELDSLFQQQARVDSIAPPRMDLEDFIANERARFLELNPAEPAAAIEVEITHSPALPPLPHEDAKDIFFLDELFPNASEEA